MRRRWMIGWTLTAVLGCDAGGDRGDAPNELRKWGDIVIDKDFVITETLADGPKIAGNVRVLDWCPEGLSWQVELQPLHLRSCLGGVEYVCEQVNTLTYECVDGEAKLVDEDVDVIDCATTGQGCETFDLPW